MNTERNVDGVWSIGVWACGAMIAGFPLMSLAGEHPEHPKAAKSAIQKEVVSAAGMLDGKTFAGELGEKGKQEGDKDEFVFQRGTFVSAACLDHGFMEAPYTATPREGSVAFTSEPVNEKSEKMRWKGTVTNGHIEGTVIHQTESGQTEYWFKGTLKAAKKAEHPEHPK